MSLDYSGADGGRLAMAFGAGCVACFGFCCLVGKLLWDRLTGANRDVVTAKDDTIAELKKTIEKNEARCAETIVALSTRVQQLETLLLLHGSGPLRNDLQKSISEQRLEADHDH
ncbi:hypothetical protein [Sphingobium sp. CAP-1]|uniref:hypothetical protein n=1 Tax=Sphingobium sp. CAP-1 TaxID=2676077 RepID=UPI0012BB1E65|nr:hypothetical protein [Sphingobium sp. CAP-1]QGP79993.1 hypothetical protein GL174_14125 [Sphingobium sp. CAP-1]